MRHKNAQVFLTRTVASPPDCEHRAVSVPDLDRQGYTNPAHCVACVTQFCTLAPNIFSTIMTVFLMRTKIYVMSRAPSRKRQITVRFAGRYRTVGPQ
jgi:hypothetical protein